MTDSFFHALKNRPIDSHQMDTDGIASCLCTMAKHIDKLHPSTQGLFNNLTEQMRTHLEALRDRRYSAYEFFIGKGTIARKLHEHATLAQWLDPTTSYRNAQMLVQIENVFNKQPTKEESELQDLGKFIEMALPLMAGKHLPGQNFEEVDENASLPELKSGWYSSGPKHNRRFVMVLNTSTGQNGVRVTLILEGGKEEQLLFQHPEEGEWFKSDYTFTFPGIAKKLQYELDVIIGPMGFSAIRKDLDAELAAINKKVDYLFDNHERLPISGVEMLIHEETETQIIIAINALYYWLFMDTRGAYPQRIYRFCWQIGTGVQTANPADLNEFSRQNMIKFLNKELDRITDTLAVIPETAAAA